MELKATECLRFIQYSVYIWGYLIQVKFQIRPILIFYFLVYNKDVDTDIYIKLHVKDKTV